MSQEMSRAAVDEELSRIEASSSFERSAGLLRLLRFLLANAEDSTEPLKETYIGAVFYHREATYDPRYDAIVRVNTKRLRERLAKYYATEGAENPAHISVPIGSYAPVVTWKPLPQAAVPEHEPPGAAVESLQAEADEAVVDADVAARPATRSASFRWKLAFLALGIAIALCGEAVLLRMTRHTREPSFVTADFEPVPLTMGRDLEFEPATSADGRRLAYVSRQAGSQQFQIFLRSFVLDGNGEHILQTGPENALYPAWSPDGKQIAFLRCGMGPCDIATVPVTGGQVRPVANLPTYVLPDDQPYYQYRQLNPVWTADGKGIIYPYRGLQDDAERLVLQDLASGARRQITSGGPGEEDAAPARSPDGKTIAFLRRSIAQTDVMTVDLETLKTRVLETEPAASTTGLSWSPDGSGVVTGVIRRRMYLVLWVPLHGKPKELDVRMPIPLNPVFSGDGKSLMVLAVNRSRNLAEVSGGSNQPGAVFQSKLRNTFNALSPDGSQLAFLSDRSGGFELWLSARQGSSFLAPRQLTTGLGWYPSSVSWSPDGRMLAVGISNTNEVEIVNARSGEMAPLRLPGLENSDTWNPVWSADGRWIYVSAWGEKNGIFRAATGLIPALEKVMDGRVREIRVDGDRALYFEPNYGRGIYKIALKGNDQRPQPIPELSNVLPARAWVVADGKIDYFDVHDPQRRFHQFDPSTGKIADLTGPIPRLAFNDGTISYSPKDRFLIYSEWSEAAGSQIVALRWH